MAQASVFDSPQSGPPKPWGRTELEGDANLLGSGLSVPGFIAPAPCTRAADPVAEGEAFLILEMRYQEYLARRALEELFERGELELLLG